MAALKRKNDDICLSEWLKDNAIGGCDRLLEVERASVQSNRELRSYPPIFRSRIECVNFRGRRLGFATNTMICACDMDCDITSEHYAEYDTKPPGVTEYLFRRYLIV